MGPEEVPLEQDGGKRLALGSHLSTTQGAQVWKVENAFWDILVALNNEAYGKKTSGFTIN